TIERLAAGRQQYLRARVLDAEKHWGLPPSRRREAKTEARREGGKPAPTLPLAPLTKPECGPKTIHVQAMRPASFLLVLIQFAAGAFSAEHFDPKPDAPFFAGFNPVQAPRPSGL